MCPEKTDRIFKRENCYEVFDYKSKCTECVKKGYVYCEDKDRKRCLSPLVLPEIDKYCTDYTVFYPICDGQDINNGC